MRSILNLAAVVCLLAFSSWQTGPSALTDSAIIIHDTVHIGNQVWMKHNLSVPGPNSYWYDRDSSHNKMNGRLYFYSGALAACPKGWHLPADEEWEAMMQETGGDSLSAYPKLLPGGQSRLDLSLAGYRSSTSEQDLFARKGESGFYWTGTVKNEQFAYARWMNGTQRKFISTWYRRSNAFSVRFVKDKS